MCFLGICVEAKDLYVSAKGKGKTASKAEPAKDLGNILELLEAGDTVHIAGGTYVGKASNGTDEITVPVSIIGGYDDTFGSRDPWGKTKTVMYGDNLTKNYIDTARIFINLSKWKEKKGYAITIDGLVIDNSGRNNYKTKDELGIVRMASPKEGKNPTPESGGIVVWIPGTIADDKTGFDVTVTNCVITNTAPTQGALTVRGGKNGRITIRNNLIVNNTGVGLFLSTAFHGTENPPEFTVSNNTVLFTWKYDAIASSFSGESMLIDDGAMAVISNNVLGIADRVGISKKGKGRIVLKDNYIFGNVYTDYYEAATDTRIALADIEDEATTLTADSTGNTAEQLAIPVNDAWKKAWASRVLIDRNSKEVDVKVQTSRANEVRSMIGLPLIAEDMKVADSGVWLNRMKLEDALAIGAKAYNGKGCSLPE